MNLATLMMPKFSKQVVGGNWSYLCQIYIYILLTRNAISLHHYGCNSCAKPFAFSSIKKILECTKCCSSTITFSSATKCFYSPPMIPLLDKNRNRKTKWLQILGLRLWDPHIWGIHHKKPPNGNKDTYFEILRNLSVSEYWSDSPLRFSKIILFNYFRLF